MRKTNNVVKNVEINTQALTEVIKNAPFQTAFKITLGIGLAQVTGLVVLASLFIGSIWTLVWLLN